MKKLISIYLSTFLVLFPCVSFSQEEEPKQEPKKITVELLDVNLVKWKGVKYILVEEETGIILFDRYDKYPKLELKIEKLAELATLYSKQLTLNTKINANLQEQNTLIVKENVGLKKIIAEGDPWYFHPILWTVVGLVCGTGITIGIMKIVKEI